MAALRGILKGSRGAVSRVSSKDSSIRASLDTWRGHITIYLEADGEYQVYVNGKNIAEGNVDTAPK